jgi:hypothetical protein
LGQPVCTSDRAAGGPPSPGLAADKNAMSISTNAWRSMPVNASAIQSSQSPEEYLAGHELTQELRRRGLTDQQLEATRFWDNNAGWPFQQWSFTWANGTPVTAIPLMKPYCALRWLILDDPPGSGDKNDAWRLVSETLFAPIYKSHLEYRNAQSKRARRPRGRLTDDGPTMPKVVRRLALKPERRDDTARELWPHLVAELDDLGLAPQSTDSIEFRNSFCTYDFKDGRKQITFGQFANLVSGARSKSG